MDGHAEERARLRLLTLVTNTSPDSSVFGSVLLRDSHTICTHPILLVVSPDLLLSALCLLPYELYSITLLNVNLHTHTFGCCLEPDRFLPETHCKAV